MQQLKLRNIIIYDDLSAQYICNNHEKKGKIR